MLLSLLVCHCQCCQQETVNHTRGVQKVRRLTQLTTRYTHHILSLFSIDPCNWNALLGSAFLQRCDTVVEELLFLVFQPAICRAIRTRMVDIVGDGVVQSRHFGWQPVLELTCDQMRCSGSKWLLFFLKLKELMKIHKIFWRRGRYLHGIWLAGRPRTTVLLQLDQTFGEMLDQAHFSCRCLCWKVKNMMCISRS